MRLTHFSQNLTVVNHHCEGLSTNYESGFYVILFPFFHCTKGFPYSPLTQLLKGSHPN